MMQDNVKVQLPFGILPTKRHCRSGGGASFRDRDWWLVRALERPSPRSGGGFIPALTLGTLNGQKVCSGGTLRPDLTIQIGRYL